MPGLPVQKKREFLSPVPNFLIVGAPRCGTTSLYSYLRQHPDIHMSSKKEPGFLTAPFSTHPSPGPGDLTYEMRYVVDFRDYRALFTPGIGKAIRGEATVHTYYYGEKAISRIKTYLGDPKILFLLRNPADRAFSGYMLKKRDKREFLPFEEALAMEAQRMAEGWHHSWFYTDLGRYARKVRLFLCHFSAVKICLYDNLKKDPAGMFRSVCSFLGVDASFIPKMGTKHNPGGIPRWHPVNRLFVRKSFLQRFLRNCGTFFLGSQRWSALRERVRQKTLKRATMKPETRRSLKKLYEDDILELQSLTGLDLSNWL